MKPIPVRGTDRLHLGLRGLVAPSGWPALRLRRQRDSSANSCRKGDPKLTDGRCDTANRQNAKGGGPITSRFGKRPARPG